MPQAESIDNYLDAHAGNHQMELCGKLAIVRSILVAEGQSLLHFKRERVNSRPNFKVLESTWYNGFFRLLVKNCRKADLPARFASVVLVVYNYDRCIEHFLYHALQNYYGMEDSEAADLVSAIALFRPYGSIGHLPWQQDQMSVEFGSEPNARSTRARVGSGSKSPAMAMVMLLGA